MEKNNQPLILGIVVIGAVLIIALALIFTRSDSGTEAPAENTASENGESGDEQTTPQPDPQPTPQPAPNPDPLPDPQPDPQPQPGVLPPNWNSLTDREKTDLNPFDCDHETQWVSAEDGSCIDITHTPLPGINLNCAELYGQDWRSVEDDSCEAPPEHGKPLLNYLGYVNCQEEADAAGPPGEFSTATVYYRCENDKGNVARVSASPVVASYVASTYDIILDSYVYSTPNDADFNLLISLLRTQGFDVYILD